MPESIALIACGKRKREHAGPARELYAGDLFRKASAYAQTHYDRWYVLSPKHGLVHPDTEIAPYDLSLRHLDAAERRAWAERVLDQIRIEIPTWQSEQFWLHAGDRYAKHLAGPLRAERPLAGLGIGRQLAWYIRHTAPISTPVV